MNHNIKNLKSLLYPDLTVDIPNGSNIPLQPFINIIPISSLTSTINTTINPNRPFWGLFIWGLFADSNTAYLTRYYFENTYGIVSHELY